MKSSRLLRLYCLLSEEERKSFHLYVHSPYFNQNERVSRLHDWLEGFAPSFDAPELTQAQAFEVIYPKRDFDSQRLYNHFSLLSRLVEQFLAQQAYEAQSHQADTFLLEALKSRKAPSQFQRIYRKAIRKLSHTKASPESLFKQYETQLHANHFFGQQQSRKLDPSLSQALQQLNQFYLLAKLKHSCELINRSNILNTHESQTNWTTVFQNFIAEQVRVYAHIPIIQLYHQTYLMLTEAEESGNYQQLVLQLAQHSPQIDQEEAAALYAYAQNFCIRQVNKGRSPYLRELFKLYQQLIQTQLIYEKGKISHWNYKNIITVGLRLEEYEWTHQFLQSHQAKLPLAYQENAYNYNLAAYLYAKQMFADAMKLLQKVEFSDVYYYLSAKAILLKVYYETEEDDALEYLIISFRTYLRRNKEVSSYQRKVYANWLKLVKKLARLRLKFISISPQAQRDSLEKLQLQINTSPEMVNKNWLQERIREMKNEA